MYTLRLPFFLCILFAFQSAFAIKGGTYATASDPAILSTVMVWASVGDNKYMKCTGVLVAENRVITASHCFYNLYNDYGDPKNSDVQVGIADAAGVDEWVAVKNFRTYPGTRKDLIAINKLLDQTRSLSYRAKTYAELSAYIQKFNAATYQLHDIAVVTLASKFQTPHAMANIDWDGSVKLGDKVQFAGYGFELENVPLTSSILKLLNMTVTHVEGNGVTLYTIEGKSLPADSGGPLYFTRDHQLFVTAINVIEHDTPDEDKFKQDYSEPFSQGATMMSLSKFKPFITSQLQ